MQAGVEGALQAWVLQAGIEAGRNLASGFGGAPPSLFLKLRVPAHSWRALV